MKHFLLIPVFCLSLMGFAQTNQLHLNNVLIVALQDKPEERFTMEVTLSEIMADCGIKTMASLNALKTRADITQIADDTIMKALADKGIDTYMLISVRGFDQNFKPAKNHPDLAAELLIGHLFPIYRDGTSSVTLEFHFYRGGKFVGYDIIKIGGVGSKEDVMKKLRKKLPRRILKKWK